MSDCDHAWVDAPARGPVGGIECSRCGAFVSDRELHPALYDVRPEYILDEARNPNRKAHTP